MAKNTSDSIEEYIKQLLAQSGIAEIKRSNLADTFQVVPSQINYVIKTRFTEVVVILSKVNVVAEVISALPECVFQINIKCLVILWQTLVNVLVSRFSRI